VYFFLAVLARYQRFLKASVQAYSLVAPENSKWRPFQTNNESFFRSVITICKTKGKSLIENMYSLFLDGYTFADAISVIKCKLGIPSDPNCSDSGGSSKEGGGAAAQGDIQESTLPISDNVPAVPGNEDQSRMSDTNNMSNGSIADRTEHASQYERGSDVVFSRFSSSFDGTCDTSVQNSQIHDSDAMLEVLNQDHPANFQEVSGQGEDWLDESINNDDSQKVSDVAQEISTQENPEKMDDDCSTFSEVPWPKINWNKNTDQANVHMRTATDTMDFINICLSERHTLIVLVLNELLLQKHNKTVSPIVEYLLNHSKLAEYLSKMKPFKFYTVTLQLKNSQFKQPIQFWVMSEAMSECEYTFGNLVYMVSGQSTTFNLQIVPSCTANAEIILDFVGNRGDKIYYQNSLRIIISLAGVDLRPFGGEQTFTLAGENLDKRAITNGT
jgi:hypothetical protein